MSKNNNTVYKMSQEEIKEITTIKHSDINNILDCQEEKIKQFKRDITSLSERLSEWTQIYGILRLGTPEGDRYLKIMKFMEE